MSAIEVSPASDERDLVSENWRDLIDQNRIIRFGLYLADRLPASLQFKGEAYLNSKLKSGLDAAVTIATSPFWLPGLYLGMGVMRLENIRLPALIAQKRHTVGNQYFKMLKIRSQVVDTSAGGIIMPTRAGVVLRKLSLDELPQMLNVLAGQMSLVGRRPTYQFDLDNLQRRTLIDLPYEKAKARFRFSDEQWQKGILTSQERSEIEGFAAEVKSAYQPIYDRFAANTGAKPSLTGLYQVLGRRRIPMEDRAQLDLFYDQNASLLLDLAILIATIPAVASGNGAR